MTITLTGFVACVYFVVFPNYLRWLDQRKFKKQGLVLPEVAGYIECDPCKTTTVSDPNAYLMGHCQAGIPQKSEEFFNFHISSAVLCLALAFVFTRLFRRLTKKALCFLRSAFQGYRNSKTVYSMTVVPYFDRGEEPYLEIFGDEGCVFGKTCRDPFVTRFERELKCRMYGNIGVAVSGYGEVIKMWRVIVDGKELERYERKRVWVTSERRVTEIYRFIRDEKNIYEFLKNVFFVFDSVISLPQNLTVLTLNNETTRKGKQCRSGVLHGPNFW